MILFVYGTRPEFLKIKPLMEELSRRGKDFYSVFSSQHADLADKVGFVLPPINDGRNRLSSVLAQTVYNLSEVVEVNDKITHILVQGDTTTALAGALVAVNAKKKLIHLEAGLRSKDFSNPYPEEYNRVLISKMADINLCPTEENKKNLLNEDVFGTCYVVGNTILDTLVPYKSKIEYQNKVLVTLHRRENHDQIDKWFKEINRLAKIYDDYEFILPLHPNPNVQKHKDILTSVKVVSPMSHNELLDTLVKCKLVISDSGGLQEECSFLRKKILVCRKETERPESVGVTSFLCSSPDKLIAMFTLHNYEVVIPEDNVSPFGNGNSSKLIANILEKEIYGNPSLHLRS